MYEKPLEERDGRSLVWWEGVGAGGGTRLDAGDELVQRGEEVWGESSVTTLIRGWLEMMPIRTDKRFEQRRLTLHGLDDLLVPTSLAFVARLSAGLGLVGAGLRGKAHTDKSLTDEDHPFEDFRETRVVLPRP